MKLFTLNSPLHEKDKDIEQSFNLSDDSLETEKNAEIVQHFQTNK